MGSCASLRAALTVCFLVTICATARANVDVYLNFDSGGASSFLTDLNTAADTAGLGLGYFNATDVGQIKTLVQQRMVSIYSGFDLTFSQTSTAGATSVKFAENGSGFGAAPFDWRNAFFAPNTKAANIYTRNFEDSLDPFGTKADNIEFISIGLSGTGAHELGHTFGLDHHDSYGVPGITPANYAATGGKQNTQIMATGPTGLSDDRSTPRAFGPLEKAKLDYANNIGPGVPFLTNEQGAAHGTAATAQTLTFADLPVSGLKGRDVANASLGAAAEEDWYKFSANAGTSLTAEAFSYIDPTNGFFGNSVDTFLELFRADGTTLLASRNNINYQDNDFSNAATLQSRSAILLNILLPATEDYYLRVTSAGTDLTGGYELFVLIPEPACLILPGLALMTMKRRRAIA